MNSSKIGNNNFIHPTAIIDPGAVIGSNNYFGPFVIIEDLVVIGNSNWFGAGTTVGSIPEVKSVVHDSQSEVQNKEPKEFKTSIGSNNVFREYVQIHRGWKGITQVGSSCFIMNQVYLAHDCIVGENVTIAAGARAAGHVEIGDHANIGLGTLIHQHRKVGMGAMIGMGAIVTKDVSNFKKAYGNPAKEHGWNTFLLEKLGLDTPQS